MRYWGILAGAMAMVELGACAEAERSWVEQCVARTRATTEFCTCLDDRRLVREGTIVVGTGRPGPTGPIELPVYKGPDIADEKACRAKIIERINRETQLQ